MSAVLEPRAALFYGNNWNIVFNWLKISGAFTAIFLLMSSNVYDLEIYFQSVSKKTCRFRNIYFFNWLPNYPKPHKPTGRFVHPFATSEANIYIFLTWREGLTSRIPARGIESLYGLRATRSARKRPRAGILPVRYRGSFITENELSRGAYKILDRQ